MKFDNKKELKQIFGTGKKPVSFIYPEMRYLTITGAGNPNQEPFALNTQALYSVMYTLKFAYKAHPSDQTFDDFVVAPLMGYWTISDATIAKGSFTKDDFVYELRIMIPSFVPSEMVTDAIAAAYEKKDFAEIKNTKVKTYPAHPVAQILHVGPYDDEPATFAKLAQFLEAENLKRTSKDHVEIYLGDPRKSAPEKLKTILQV